MAFINRVCDKVFVINLDKDKGRLNAFDKCMELNSIKYERLPAVDGSKVKNDPRLTDFCNMFCTNGIKGCALSHRTIWEKMVENNYKNVLVFEDDAVVDKEFDKTKSFNGQAQNEPPKFSPPVPYKTHKLPFP